MIDHSIQDIRARLRTGFFTDEAEISRGIVMRVLADLGWPTHDADIVWPQFGTEGKRVDFALCHPPRKALVYIEVKRSSQGQDPNRNLFKYAFQLGIPFAILTDGRAWRFLLPSEPGNDDEGPVYTLDILERDVVESVAHLQRYLLYRQVCTGEAIDAARLDFRDVANERKIFAALPHAWKKLLDDDDKLLLKLVSDRVESLCGYRPNASIVTAFLREGAIRTPSIPTAPRDNRTVVPSSSGAAMPKVVSWPNVKEPETTPRRAQATRHLLFRGRVYPVRNGRDALLQTLRLLVAEDATFLDRFSQVEGARRRYLARNREDLNPTRPDLARQYSVELAPGSVGGLTSTIATTRSKQ